MCYHTSKIRKKSAKRIGISLDFHAQGYQDHQDIKVQACEALETTGTSVSLYMHLGEIENELHFF